MKTVDICDAKIHLSLLIDEAAGGEPFIIVSEGKPVAIVTAYGVSTPREVCRLGFLNGSISVPDDFDTIGAAEIEGMFSGEADAR